MNKVVVFFFTIFYFAAKTQPFASFDSPNFVNLTEKSGLASKRTTALAQDKQGFVWIGTNEGVCRYDGGNCKNFKHHQTDTNSIGANYINNILPQNDGTIWVAAIGALDLYLPDKQTFKHFSSKLKGTYAKCLLEENQDWIWVGTMQRDNYEGGGLHLLNKKTGECGFWKISDFLKKDKQSLPFEFKYNSITAICKDQINPTYLWVTSEAGIGLFDIQQFRFIGFWNYPNIAFNEYQFATSVLSDTDGSLWVGVWGLGLYHFYPQKNNWIYVDILPQVKDSYKIVTCIKNKSNNELILGTGFGAIILDKYTNKVEIWEHDYRDPDSFIGYLVWDILMDSNGIKWFATESGVSRLDMNQNFAQFFFPNPSLKLNNNISRVTGFGVDSPNKRFLLSTDAGENVYIADFERKTHKVIRYFEWKNKSIEPRYFQASTTDRKGNFWLYSQGELFVIKSGKDRIESFPTFDSKFKKEFSPQIQQIHEDDLGNLWLLGQEDIFKLNINNQSFTYFNIKKYTLPNIKPNDYIIDILTNTKGEAFINTSNGLLVIRGTSIQHILPFEGNENGLNHIRGIAFDEEENLWMSIAFEGLIKTKIRENELEIKKDKHGNLFHLEGNTFQILYHKGHIWIAKNDGITLFNIADATTKKFDQNHGLRERNSVVVAFNWLFKQSNSGNFLFATNGGKLGIFNPDELLLQKEAKPALIFSDFKVFGNSLNLMQNIDFQKDIHLTYKENFFNIIFAAIHFSNHKDLEYAYRLEGIDADWVNTTNAEAKYTNLKGGDYIFRVKAKNRSGEQSEERILNIHIEPPLWEKTWFQLLLLLLIIASIFSFYKYRIFQIKEKNRIEQLALQSEIKALQAQMNPHFMFNTLNTIKSAVLSEKPLVASEYLSDFAYLLRQTLQQSREKTIPLHDDLETLLLYIRLEMLRFHEKFDFEYRLNPDVPIEELTIPPMILQPFVENAIRHAFNEKKEKGVLILEITYSADDTVLCIIDDNGSGRKPKQILPSDKHQSLGMTITNERVQLHNQLNDNKIDIKIIDKKDENKNGSGTRVEVRLIL